MKRNLIFLDMFDFEKVIYPDVISSGGLGPCIAVGFYNSKLKEGYMVHEPCFHDSKSLDRIINSIKSDGTNLNDLTVYATGNSISCYDDETQKKYNLADRVYVESVLKSFFSKSQLTIKWAKKDTTSELYLDTLKEQFLLQTISNKELFTGNYTRLYSSDEFTLNLPQSL